MTFKGEQVMRRMAKGIPGLGGARKAQRNELISALQAHARLIISSAIRIVGTLHDAEDIAQDIAERLLRSPPVDVRNWPAYLKTLTVNQAIDRLRRRRPTTDTEALATSTTPESEVAAGERSAALRRALGNLAHRDATLFSLYYLADLSQAEIARQLEMTENAVGVALHRVRQRLGDDIRTQLKLDQEAH